MIFLITIIILTFKLLIDFLFFREDFLFDGFDAELHNLTDCSPFFNTICVDK